MDNLRTAYIGTKGIKNKSVSTINQKRNVSGLISIASRFDYTAVKFSTVLRDISGLNNSGLVDLARGAAVPSHMLENKSSLDSYKT